MEILKIVNNKTLQLGLLFALGVTLRLLPHVPNFTAVGAIALFSGAVLSRRAAILLPLAIMAASDVIIGFYPGMIYTWFGFIGVACFGMAFRRRSFRYRVLIGGLGGSIIFFVVSNFGVWRAGGLYPATMAGLSECYIMAIPFFGATLASSVLYGAVLFGAESMVTLLHGGTAMATRLENEYTARSLKGMSYDQRS